MFKHLIVIAMIIPFLLIGAEAPSKELSGKPLTLNLEPPILVKVVKPHVDEQEAARNLRLIQERAFPWKTAVMLMTLGLGAYLFQIFFKKSWKRWHSPLQLDPRTKALVALQAMRQKEKEGEKSREAVYAKLSDTIREYIVDYYHVDAPHYTTQEFLQKATFHATMDKHHQELLSRFLQQADLVKFALYPPTDQDIEDAENTIAQFIRG